MLFLVISDPRPEPPSSVTGQRQAYWRWIEPLRASGQVKSVHARVGRGAVVLFDVDRNETLHRFLNEWGDIIPAHFAVYPLIDPSAAQHYLGTQTPAKSPKVLAAKGAAKKAEAKKAEAKKAEAKKAPEKKIPSKKAAP